MILFLRSLELLIIVLTVIIVIFQIWIPIIKGTPLFSMFRKNRKQLAGQLKEAHENLEVLQEKIILAKLQDQARTLDLQTQDNLTNGKTE